MDNNKLWNRMERLAQKNTALFANNMEFTRLIKEAYDENLYIWIACEHKKGNDKQALYAEDISQGVGKRGLQGIGNIRKGYTGTACVPISLRPSQGNHRFILCLISWGRQKDGSFCCTMILVMTGYFLFGFRRLNRKNSMKNRQ